MDLAVGEKYSSSRESGGDRMMQSAAVRKPKSRLIDLDADAKAIIFRTVVSRFMFPDFSVYGSWMVDRLRTIWPGVNERSIIGWLRGCSESKEYHFVKTPHAVGMAEVTYQPLTSIAKVGEIFVIVDNKMREKSLYEGCAIYGEFKRWSKTIGSGLIGVGVYTDVPLELIECAIGKIKKQEISFVDVR
ncbi:MAG: hypothetical protein KGJ13_09300 [Patescibacteria group bacterium]|nr:hypothetical protein [Patescibacteria group bacterium]